MNPRACILLLCLTLAGCGGHPRHVTPYWITDHNVPQQYEYVYRAFDGRMEYLGWVFQDIGASNDWVAVYYSGTGIAVRTVYYPTRREAMSAIERWYK